MNEEIFEAAKKAASITTSNVVTQSNISEEDAFGAIDLILAVNEDQLYQSFNAPKLRVLLKDMILIATFQLLEEARKRAGK